MMTIQGAIECESLHVVNRTSGVGVERQDVANARQHRDVPYLNRE